MNRRGFLKMSACAGALPFFDIGCAGFGLWAGLRGGGGWALEDLRLTPGQIAEVEVRLKFAGIE